MIGERPSEVVDRLNTELRAKPRHCLGPEPLNAQERDGARGIPLSQRLELLHPSGLQQLDDLRRRALADALDLLKLLDGQAPQVGRLRGDGLGGALVGADAERLRVSLVEHRQLGEVPQHIEDILLRVSHAIPS